MTKFMLAVMVGASALAFAPQPVAAAECTEEYHKCLNDSWYYDGISQTMADVECFAGYVGCVRTRLFAS